MNRIARSVIKYRWLRRCINQQVNLADVSDCYDYGALTRKQIWITTNLTCRVTVSLSATSTVLARSRKHFVRIFQNLLTETESSMLRKFRTTETTRACPKSISSWNAKRRFECEAAHDTQCALIRETAAERKALQQQTARLFRWGKIYFCSLIWK